MDLPLSIYIYTYIILLSLNTDQKSPRKRGFSRSELVINKWTAACLRRDEALEAPWLDTRISADLKGGIFRETRVEQKGGGSA